MSSQHRRNPAVQKPTEGQLLRRGLGVKIDDLDLSPLPEPHDLLLGASERTVDVGHENPSLQVQNPEPDALAGDALIGAAPRDSRRIVVRTQQPGLVIDTLQDFLLVPDVVARGHDVHTHGQDLAGDARSDAETSGGVLHVGNDQVDVVLPAESRNHAANDLAAPPAHDVPHKKNHHAETLFVVTGCGEAGARLTGRSPRPSFPG